MMIPEKNGNKFFFIISFTDIYKRLISRLLLEEKLLSK